MTNNLEDFEQPDLESNGEPPPSHGMRANLANAWRTKPLFKLLVLMTVAGAIIAVSINLFSSKPPGEKTTLAAPPQGFRQPPGGQASPYFRDQTKKAEEDRVKTAITTGASVLPTPMGDDKSIEDLTNNDKGKKDPLVELRQQIERQKQQIAQIKQQQSQPAAAPAAPKPEPFDEGLAQAMQKQMQQLMGGWEPKGIKQVSVAKDEDLDAVKKAAANGSSSAEADAAAAASRAAQQQQKIIVPAGTVSYAQMLTEANSDAPGPILAQIVSGPLSGARAVGEFKVSNDFLVIKFSLANLKGKDYSIDALALDPDTTLGAMVTEVDHRYFTRVILPAAAGFVQAFGSALGQGSSSVVANGQTTIVQQSGKGLEEGLFQGLGQAGQTMGQFFQSEANKVKPLVRVAAGTPMGLFFVSSVIDRGNQQQYPYPMPGTPGYQGYSGYGSYGNANSAFGATTSGGYYSGYSGPAFSGPVYGQPAASSTGAADVPYPNPGMPYSPGGYNSPYGGYGGYNNYGAPGTYYGVGTPGISP